ncbi:unnamed protein product [Hapterophycus canaliculatus]
MIAGVGLQGFGRLALAKLYVKTEAVINTAASATATDTAQHAPTASANSSGSGGWQNDGARGGSVGSNAAEGLAWCAQAERGVFFHSGRRGVGSDSRRDNGRHGAVQAHGARSGVFFVLPPRAVRRRLR